MPKKINIRVTSRKESGDVQRKLFELGYEWEVSGTTVNHDYAPILVIYLETKRIHYSYRKRNDAVCLDNILQFLSPENTLPQRSTMAYTPPLTPLPPDSINSVKEAIAGVMGMIRDKVADYEGVDER